ncbi:choline transporter [Diplodia seriata]|uniref:Choline transporter n=1 Tax=Diplodia seriata TaxID=420778 RepID=A0ABR3CBE9_9PEZI
MGGTSKEIAESDRRPSFMAGEVKAIDADAAKLAEMGYTQDMQRNFSVWSVLGVGFSLTNSWFGISAALVTGINSGGPLLIVYGIMIIACISVCVGISLSELASALPNAGGQYFWANELAPKRYANFASYLTGCVIESWHVFVAYQVVNIFCFVFNCYGKVLPAISSTTLYISLISFAVILITIPAKAPTHQHASFVFATFINNTGWTSNGIAFIVGLVNTNWAFACLDCATHLAEEVHQPERMIPIAIMGTVGIGFVTSWTYSVAMFFSIVGDFQELVATPTLVPILELFSRALSTSSPAPAIVLEALIIATGLGCLVASHTWQSRLCWSFARDRGLPFHTALGLARVHPRLDVPLAAHAVSCALVAAVGCLYLGSYTAFNSMVTACIVLLYVSYSIPVACLLLRGRNSIAHGPFWLGPVGAVANCVLLAWTAFTVVMYSFPYSKPVLASNMNYVSAVYGVVCAIMGVDWVCRGRREYRGQSTRHEQVEEVVRRAESVGEQGTA